MLQVLFLIMEKNTKQIFIDKRENLMSSSARKISAALKKVFLKVCHLFCHKNYQYTLNYPSFFYEIISVLKKHIFYTWKPNKILKKTNKFMKRMRIDSIKQTNKKVFKFKKVNINFFSHSLKSIQRFIFFLILISWLKLNEIEYIK